MRLFTIGHGAAGFADVAALLERNGIATIVDVRSEPWSRHAPDFSRRRLESLAASAGFGYRWLGDALGGRPQDPALVGPDGALDHAAIAASPPFRAALGVLEELAAGATVVLLCAEARPSACHRSTLLAPALLERGHEVIHLLHDGSTQPHHPSLKI